MFVYKVSVGGKYERAVRWPLGRGRTTRGHRGQDVHSRGNQLHGVRLPEPQFTLGLWMAFQTYKAASVPPTLKC